MLGNPMAHRRQGGGEVMRIHRTGSPRRVLARRVVALADGRLEEIYFHAGEYVAPATPVLALLPPASVRVRFFVPEGELARLRVGGRVRIICDGCQPVEAKVSFIAREAEYTPPVIFSVGNREKLVFKVEARAAGGLPLHPGQPVEVRPL